MRTPYTKKASVHRLGCSYCNDGRGILHDGLRESAQSWRELLLDLKHRGLAIGPELAVGDGALGFRKALDEVCPKTRAQLC